jgi:predicted permease
MLGHAYWTSMFGHDASVVGRTLQIDAEARVVIGILPRDFHFLDEPDAALLLPLRFDRAAIRLGQFNYPGIARLKPGVTIAQANADVARMLPIVLRSFPAPDGFGLKLFEDARIVPNLGSLKDDIVGNVGGTLGVVMAGIAFVLLIACANVSNLWLVRLEGRQHDLALRAALGAGRARLARELLTECLILGLASGAIGLVLAGWLLRGLVALAPAGLPRVRDIELDWTVVLVTLGAAVLASLLVGTLPSLKHAGASLGMRLRAGGRSLSQTREQTRMRGTLVVVQVALALVLMIASGLMIRSFVAMTQVNPGFVDGKTLQTFRLFIPADRAREPDHIVSTQKTILDRLRAVPGVSAVALTSGVPMDGNSNNDPVFAQDRTYREGEVPQVRRFVYVMPGFFGTMGTSLVAGRDLTWPELERRTPVALVSQSFAVEHWTTPARALGKRIRVATTDDWRDVIGVVSDVYDEGVSQEPTPTVYWPVIQNRFEGDAVSVPRTATFVVRTPRAGTDALLKDLQQAVWTVTPGVPLFSVSTVEAYSRRSLARTTFTLIVLGAVGGMAFLLAVIGLYGVIAYAVSQRQREIGVRLALGAEPRLLIRMFVRDGLRLAIVGVLVGLAGSAMIVRLMSSLLFNVSAVDPVTYLAVSSGLMATSFAAAYLPSRRVAGVDPAIVLRAE